jgi:hypothetical protein
MTERKVLPEKCRLACNLKEGMEVIDYRDDKWYAITDILRIYSPINVVSVSFADGSTANYSARDQVMSR